VVVLVVTQVMELEAVVALEELYNNVVYQQVVQSQ
tara:strand:+ start:122 stop:226 length:105 start_codon:yes stop_codon:yes gene_type:complete